MFGYYSVHVISIFDTYRYNTDDDSFKSKRLKNIWNKTKSIHYLIPLGHHFTVYSLGLWIKFFIVAILPSRLNSCRLQLRHFQLILLIFLSNNFMNRSFISIPEFVNFKNSG